MLGFVWKPSDRRNLNQATCQLQQNIRLITITFQFTDPVRYKAAVTDTSLLVDQDNGTEGGATDESLKLIVCADTHCVECHCLSS